MYDKELNNIDITKKSILTSEETSNQTNTEEQNSEDNQLESYVFLILNSPDNKITLTFDNGSLIASLTTKKFDKTVMKWTNSSTYEFDWVGIYESSINGYYIKLENVIYSKNLNKNILSGIKIYENRQYLT